MLLLSGSRTRSARLAEDLRNEELNSFYTEDMDRVIEPGEIMTAFGHAKKGFEYPLIKFVVITESDIFGQEKKKNERNPNTAASEYRALMSLVSEIMWFMKIMDWEFIRELRKLP